MSELKVKHQMRDISPRKIYLRGVQWPQGCIQIKSGSVLKCYMCDEAGFNSLDPAS